MTGLRLQLAAFHSNECKLHTTPSLRASVCRKGRTIQREAISPVIANVSRPQNQHQTTRSNPVRCPQTTPVTCSCGNLLLSLKLLTLGKDRPCPPSPLQLLPCRETARHRCKEAAHFICFALFTCQRLKIIQPT